MQSGTIHREPMKQRLIHRFREWLQRLIVPDYAGWRAELAAMPEAVRSSLDLGRALNAKADLINGKIDALADQFADLQRRQDELAEDIATIDALSWDRTALARRLAQLEDRLIALSPDVSAGSDHDERWPSLRFPGLDRYEDRVRDRGARGLPDALNLTSEE